MNRKIDEKVEQELMDIRWELKMKIQVLKFQLDLVEAVLFSEYVDDCEGCCQSFKFPLNTIKRDTPVGEMTYQLCDSCIEATRKRGMDFVIL